MLEDHNCEELAMELAFEEIELDYKKEAKENPETVIKAFLRVAEVNQDRIWDQFLVENLLLPSIR